ncbi:biotin synthase auxiliary protein BsaP [Pseudarthrobacter scleromae]|uniref:Biotin synthase auxiliary protein n=1 Tax=Pseudarthrobacter scleromae TaxID=158897 RepID=A0ABQ2CHK9_9MICC|nr:hypothetical protein GCM10007175_26580 [Pseudarthrobacter scleromae]
MIPNRSTSSIIGSVCGHCGELYPTETFDGGSAPPSNVLQTGDVHMAGTAHRECAARLQLEPPRYCGQCGRRLKVQVSPHAWTASCSRHGTATS